MTQRVLTPAGEVGWVGVSKPHFTNEKADAKDTRGAHQNTSVTPGWQPHTLGPRLLAGEETLAEGLG